MVKTGDKTQTHLSTGAIWFAAFIGIGFCILLGTFGGAIAVSFAPEKEKLPSDAVLTLIAIASVIMLSAAFFIAGYIASKASHQRFRFDSIVHSLSTWSIMSMLLGLMVSAATVGEEMRWYISKIEAPVMVTDIEVMDAKAKTSIKTGSDKKEKITPEEKKSDKVFTFIWWACFSSLMLGAATSIAGGLLGREKLLE